MNVVRLTPIAGNRSGTSNSADVRKGNNGMHRRILAGTLICLLAAGFAFALAMTSPAAAQGFFDRIFGPSPGGGIFSNPEPQRPVDASRAPAPRKPDTPPTSSIVVVGDSMADWLAYGLEDALTDTPEVGIVRKHRTGSGLIRYDLRNEALDWAQGARELLSAEKPNYIVMMIGLNDRQAIRVRQAVAPARGATPPAEKPQTPEPDQENPEQPAIVTPEAQRARAPGVYEFHSEKWEELYTKRIDDTIAVLKSKGVPVFWVGLPSLRTPKATTEAQYLNELFRARAEKAGIVYVDVWDGFVDDLGHFTLQGPDYEGQNRRLRAGDGIHFTKAGARKLAHYVEREINRAAPLTPVALAVPDPREPTTNARPSGATARPLNGLAVPLMVTARTGEELIGSPGNRGGDADTQIVTHVLVKGEPIIAPAGRADDFAWPRRGIAAFGSDPVVTSTTMPVPLAQLPPPPVVTEPASKQAARQASQSASQSALPRTPGRPSFNPFSFFGLFR
jgi:uncharacterized protein